MAKFLTVTELAQKTTSIVKMVETTREEVIITKNGKPVVVINPFSEQEFGMKGAKYGKG